MPAQTLTTTSSANPAGMPAVSLYLIPVYRPLYRYTGKPAVLGGDMKNITERVIQTVR
jgi:hypothetical protein